MIRWARDLSTCTENELRTRWAEKDLIEAINILERSNFPQDGFERRVSGHNPLFYLAENLFFDNVRGDSDYLWAPFHVKNFCEPMLDFYGAPTNAYTGFLLLAQRDSFKSVFGHGVAPMFCTLRAWHLEGRYERLALIHQKFAQASINLNRLREKSLTHPWFREVWTPFCAEDKYGTQETFNWPVADQFMSQIGAVSVVAAGLTSDLTGYHFDDMFFSDLVVKEHSKSKIMRENTEMLYKGFKYTLDQKRGRKWHDGTRYHINDLWGKLLKDERLRKVEISAGADPSSGLNLPPLSFPTRHSWEKLQIMRQEEIDQSGTDMMWWLQMQNMPRASSMLAADIKWFKEIKPSEIPGDCWRATFVDPAWKGTKNQGEGCNASIQSWAFWRVGNLVLQALLELTCSNEMTDADGRKEVIRHMRKWNIMDVAPEERGGKSFGTNLANDCVSIGLPLNIIELKSQQTGKEQRIASFLGTLQSGRVYIMKGCNAKPLLDEVEDYPQTELKDNVDCAGYTADPAITEAYTPLFNTQRLEESRPWARQPERDFVPQLTRYCGV